MNWGKGFISTPGKMIGDYMQIEEATCFGLENLARPKFFGKTKRVGSYFLVCAKGRSTEPIKMSDMKVFPNGFFQ